PKQFAESCRLEAFKGSLRARPSVTEAIYDAGFGSSSRVYERSDKSLGMTPAAYRAGGRGVAISYVVVDSALGRVMMAATDRGVCAVQFGASDKELAESLRAEYPAAQIEPMRRPYPAEF